MAIISSQLGKGVVEVAGRAKEDLETNYWFHGKTIYMYRTTNTGIHTTAAWSVVKKIEQITQVLMRHQIGASNLTVMPGDASLCSVEWGMNLVKLRKCTTAERLRNPPMAKKQVYDQKAGVESVSFLPLVNCKGNNKVI